MSQILTCINGRGGGVMFEMHTRFFDIAYMYLGVGVPNDF